MAERTKDMTQGRPAGLLLSFAVPLMAGNIVQQLYTIVDTAIVGQFVGVEALAALGAVEWLLFLVQGCVAGFSQGFSILIAQRFGAEDGDGLRRGCAMSVLLIASLTLLTAAASLLTLRPVLRLMRTPENVFADAFSYSAVIFGGLAAYAGYNVLASILRSLGNSRAPLAAMVLAALTNVALDLLFVIGFHWGVAGAALATVIAQALSLLFCLLVIRKIPALALTAADWKPERTLCLRLLRLGFPVAFQNIVISVGGMVVQAVINGFGFLYVAGFTATNKLYGLLEVAATSYGFSVATYTGQNLGAGRYNRIRQGTRSAAIMGVATSAGIAAAMLLCGRPILRLFISGEAQVAASVLDIAYFYLQVMSYGLPVLYLLYVYRSALQGMGDTITPLCSGIAELVCRVGVILLLPLAIGEIGLFFAEDAAWLAAAILLAAVYYLRAARMPHTDETTHHKPMEG